MNDNPTWSQVIKALTRLWVSLIFSKPVLVWIGLLFLLEDLA